MSGIWLGGFLCGIGATLLAEAFVLWVFRVFKVRR